MRQILHNILYIGVLSVMAGSCTGGHSGSSSQEGRGREWSDSVAFVRHAMDIYDYRPERALQIIDSAVTVGKLGRSTGDYYRAKIYSWTVMGGTVDSLLHGPEGVRFDSAMAIGTRLLGRHCVLSDTRMHRNVLEVMIYSARMRDDTAVWLRRSMELVDVCHEQGAEAETEALRTEAEVGAVLCYRGDTERGMARIDSVLTVLDTMQNRRFNELDAQIIALKRKIVVLGSEGKAIELIPLARRIIERLDDYERRPDDYSDGSYREPRNATERADYITFYRSQARNYITAAYASIGNGNESMGETYDRIERSVRELTAREHIARYHSLEQQLLRQEAESRNDRLRTIVIACGAGMMVILVFIVLIVMQNRKIRRKNLALVRLIDRQGPSRDESLTEDRATLFRKIDTVIRAEHLYCDVNLQRQTVCDRFAIRRDVLNQLLSDYAAGQSFPAYINSIRLSEACRQLGEENDKTVNAIADSVGLSPRNLRRLFVEQYGMTPTEYRQGLRESDG